ncbi:hypothetical protein OG896_22270 [Streptomyces sp. NBC_00669]|uniref:hypothetical protein n=1 Tax=unclassified Streptomyces TaxID=2593676 RepID=UPI002E1B8F79|nr:MULTISPECIES: hypothetical protein [unclassified Streptomyces]
MNRNVRNATPPIYALLILGGFLINTTVGIAVIIVGGVLTSMVYTMARGGGAEGTPRRAPRQRNRR